MGVGIMASAVDISAPAWSPLSLPSLAAWLDPVDATKFTLSGSDVMTHTDKSPNAYVATASALATANRPKRAGTINGVTALTYNGSQWMRSNIPASGKPFSFATVVNLTAGTVDRSFIGSTDIATEGAGGWHLRASNTTDNFVVNLSNTLEVLDAGVPVPEGVPTYIVFTYSGAGAWILRFNGAQVASGTNNQTPTASRYHIIGNNAYNAATEAFTGTQGDIILTNAVVAGADLTSLESWLQTRWSVFPPTSGFRRALGTGVSSTSNTTVTITTTGVINIGDLVVIRVAADNFNASAPTFIASDTTANVYTTHVQRVQGTATALSGVAGAIIACKATVARAAGSVITITLNQVATAKAAHAESFFGFNNTVRSTAVSAGGTSTAAAAPDTGTVNSGDLVLAATAVESNAAITGDSDTLNGSWSTAVTTFNASGGTATGRVEVSAQYKIATAAGAQSFAQTVPNTDWVAMAVVLQLA